MPTYHARGVSTRLGIMPLLDTTTSSIVLKKGDTARKQCDAAEQQLLNSRFLTEKRVTFPGDDLNFELNWLGGAPFMQAEVERDLFTGGYNPPAHSSSLVGALGLHPTPDPLALSLHVITSERTFVSGLDNSNKLHIKIEVFLNGRLSDCRLFPPYEYRSGSKAFHQVFGGHRVDFLAERPWVLLPPNIAADGSQRKPTGLCSAEQRWREICEALSTEADYRGQNEHSEVPPTAEFLKALAAMDMPHQVRDMQSPGGRKLGIIDVIVTAGNGRKVTSGAAYLKAPQRFDDENFPLCSITKAAASIDTTIHASHSEVEAYDTSVSTLENEGVQEGQTVFDMERYSKRRAINSGQVPGSHNQSHLQYVQLQGLDCTVGPTASYSPPKELREETHLPTMLNMPSSIVSTPRPREADHSRSSSPERVRRYQAEFARQPSGSCYSGTLYGTPQSLFSFSSPSISHAHTPQLQPSPYSFQFAGSTSSQHSPAAIPSSYASEFSDIASSFFPTIQPVVNRPVSRPLSHSNSLDSNHLSDHGLPSPNFLPSICQQSPQRSSMDFPPMSNSTPQVWPGNDLYSQLSLPNHISDFALNMVPSLAFQNHSTRSPVHKTTLHSPFDHRLSMPLPPTGFFSVPTKPKPKPRMSPGNQAQLVQIETRPRSISVRRLVIQGKDGVGIVDHTWPVPQRVPMRGQTSPSPFSKPYTGNDSPFSGSCVASVGRASELSSQSHVEHAPHGRESGSQSSNVGIEINNPSNTINGEPVSSQRMQGIGVTGQQIMRGPERPSNDNTPASEAKAGKRNTFRPAVSQRRTVSGQSILGIQGPKAATFWFEDPEQLIREAAKERRTKAPRKPMNRATNSLATMSMQVAAAPTISPAIPLSPLRSVHKDSGLDRATDTEIYHFGPQDPSVLDTKRPLSQLDSSSDRPQPIPTASSFPRTLSTEKQRASAAPTVRRYLEKQPRSPERLTTISNPLLNQDCVIALAESEDKSVKRGILRQIRGERQGTFAEEYVVSATRFYVPGT